MNTNRHKTSNRWLAARSGATFIAVATALSSIASEMPGPTNETPQPHRQSVPADAATPGADLAQLKPETDRFMSSITQGRPEEAFAGLTKLKCTKRMEDYLTDPALTNRLHTMVVLNELDFGKQLPGGYEFLGSLRFGNSVLRLVYLEKHEYWIIPWSLDFWKSRDGWMVAGVEHAEDAMQGVGALFHASTNLEQPKQLVEHFMAAMNNGTPHDAIGELVNGHWIRHEEAAANSGKLEAAYLGGEKIFGDRTGKILPNAYEMVAVQSVGQSVAKIICVEKHEYGFVPWSFLFYKPSDDWKVVEFSMGDNVGQSVLDNVTISEPVK